MTLTTAIKHVLTFLLFNHLLYRHLLYRHLSLSSLNNIYINTTLTRPTVSFGRPCCATDKVCVGKKCYAHPVLTGTVIPCMGTRDYRPTPAPPANSSLHNCPRGHDRVPAKADGIYLENAHNISFSNVIFEYELPRKDYYGTCIQMDQWSTNVSGVDDITCINGQTIQGRQNSISTLITIDASLGIVQKVDEKFISFTIDSGDSKLILFLPILYI